MDNYVLGLLKKGFSGENMGRTDTNIHASDLKEFCPRKLSICKREKVPFHKKEYIGTGLALTFALGHKVQSIVTGKLRKSGFLVGSWKCLNCGDIIFGLEPLWAKKICPSCKEKTLFMYQDTGFKLDEYDIPVVGNVDSFVLYGKKLIMVEIKSIRPEDFDTLTSPSGDYARQVRTYLWMFAKSAKLKAKTVPEDYKIITNKAVILYICKTQKKVPFKAFVVQQDKDFCATLEAKLGEVKDIVTKGNLPKPICTSKGKMMARNCHVRDYCFANRKEK